MEEQESLAARLLADWQAVAQDLCRREAQDPAGVRELLHLLGGLGGSGPAGEAAARALLRYRRESRVRPLQKLAGHMLARLDRAGVAVEAVKRDGRPALVLPDELEAPGPDESCLLSLAEGEGSRLLVLPVRVPGTGLCVLRFLLTDAGVKDVSASPGVSRRAWQELWREAVGDGELLMAGAPRDYGAQVVDEALAAAGRSGAPLPPALAAWRAYLPRPRRPYGPLLPETAPAEAEAVRTDLPTWLRAAGELLELPAVRSWAPAPQALAAEVEALEAMTASGIQLPEHVEKERFDRLLRSAARRLYEGEGAGRLAARLHEAAYVLFRRDRRPLARAALAAAWALEDGPPERHPLVQRLVALALARAVEERGSRVAGWPA